MKILRYLLFLTLSFIIIFGFDFLMRLAGEQIYSLKNFWAITIVAFSTIILKSIIGEILNLLKISLSKLNPFKGKGRIPVIILGWFILINMIYTMVVFLTESLSFSILRISAIIFFYLIAIMVLITNFCYFKYTDPNYAED